MKNKHLASVRGTILLLCAFVFTFTACNNDSEPLYEGYGIVLNKQDASSYTILLDDGNLLYPRESYVNPDKLRDSMRLYLCFSVLKEMDSSYDVRITFADSILTKNIIAYDESILDSIGNDPVKITKSWFAHGFLNFEFMFAGRINMDSHHSPMVNLLQCPSEDNTLKFEFRHNDFGDCRDKVYVGVVSFPIRKVTDQLEKPVKMEIKFSDSENTTRSIEMIYR